MTSPEIQLPELLRQLIAFRTDTTEAAQAEWLRVLLVGWHGDVRLETVQPGRVNLLATFAGRNPRRSILLEAHGDTVAGDVPLRLDAASGRLYGRGACDCKASLAAMLASIARTLAEDGLPPVTVQLAVTCREETGGEGAQALMAAGCRADVVVVGEPTRLVPLRALKGAWRCRVVTHGVAAHSSTPERGRNAIYRMRQVLEMLETRYPPLLAARRHPLLGAPTMSVGTICGGTAVNVVPAACEIEVDWRVVPGLRGDELLADLRATFPDATITPCEFYPAFYEPDGSPALALAQQACTAVFGHAVAWGTAPWAANAGFFCEAGLPCVVLGPGDIAQAHTADEYVELRQVEQAAEVYRQMVRATASWARA